MKRSGMVNKEKKDLRYVKTERLIRKSFHELAQEKDMNRITVRELVEKAEINKTTFYSHYETLPDLIDTLERENIDYIMDNLDQVELLYRDSDLFIENLYQNLKDCRIVTIGKNGAGSKRFIERLKNALSEEIYIRGIDAKQYKKTQVILKFILHGILGIISTETEEDNEIDYIKSLVKNGLKKDCLQDN